jgi:hypothetical protein
MSLVARVSRSKVRDEKALDLTSGGNNIRNKYVGVTSGGGGRRKKQEKNKKRTRKKQETNKNKIRIVRRNKEINQKNSDLRKREKNKKKTRKKQEKNTNELIQR